MQTAPPLPPQSAGDYAKCKGGAHPKPLDGADPWSYFAFLFQTSYPIGSAGAVKRTLLDAQRGGLYILGSSDDVLHAFGEMSVF